VRREIPTVVHEQLTTLLRRGRDRGEIGKDVDLDVAASLVMGPFVFRRLLLQKARARSISAPLSTFSCAASTRALVE
jgi:hypothetical protein